MTGSRHGNRWMEAPPEECNKKKCLAKERLTTPPEKAEGGSPILCTVFEGVQREGILRLMCKADEETAAGERWWRRRRCW